MPGDDALGLHGRNEEPPGDRSWDGAGAGAEASRSGVEAHALDCWPQAVALSRHARLRSVVEPTCVMATRFSSNATVQVPRLLIALSIVVFITGAFSLTISGSGVSVVLPAAVVLGMGVYFNGARRYDVMDDKIRTVGILGLRDLELGTINAFEDALPEPFTSRLQSFLPGAPLSSAI